MAAAGVDIVVLGGVPINLSRGHDNAEQMIRELEAELKRLQTAQAKELNAILTQDEKMQLIELLTGYSPKEEETSASE